MTEPMPKLMETSAMIRRVVEALRSLPGIRDVELGMCVAGALCGDADGLEWAAARIGDLQEASEALRAVMLAGLDAGGWVTLINLAMQEGVTYSGAIKRLDSGGRYEAVDGPSSGRGPRMQRYVRVVEGRNA
ncbi:MAG: hypothetical protein WC211_12430 [Dehalococcoidia bacterium]